MENTEINKNRQNHIDMFRLLKRHPYICLVCAFILFIPFGFGQKEHMSTICSIYGCVIMAVLLFSVSFSKSFTKSVKTSLLFFSVSVALEVAYIILTISFGFKCDLMFLIIFVIILLYTLLMYQSKNLTTQNLIIMVFCLGLMLRLIYVLATHSDVRQHDVGYFDHTWGHANYIEYWYNNGLKLPDFNVTTIWQYYHPPLHHMLMALLLKILTQFGVPYETACDALQLLPLLYSSMCMVVSYKIFRALKIKGTPLFLSCLVLAFHPFFIIFAGAYNNDILSILFILFSVLFTIRWYKDPKMKNIIPVALSVGLGMMTKLSVWMIAPAIALVFLMILLKSEKKKKLILQFIVFALICFPLALWWQTRNLILFDVPITYVPALGADNPQYLGDMSYISRLTDFSQLSYPYDGFPDYGAPFYEINPIVGLFKTAVFDEGNFAINTATFPQIEYVGPVVLWLSIILFMSCLVFFIISIIKKDSLVNPDMKIFFAAAFLVFILFYFLFCYKYPYTCTMNMRYCAPVIVFLLLGMSVFLQGIKNGRTKSIMTKTMTVLCVLFSFSSMVMFLMIC